jgi:hypothetical protein
MAGLGETMKYPQFEAREFIATGGRVVMLFFELPRVKATGI